MKFHFLTYFLCAPVSLFESSRLAFVYNTPPY